MINFKSFVYFVPFVVQNVLTKRITLHFKGTMNLGIQVFYNG
jgi:hypothetical protein